MRNPHGILEIFGPDGVIERDIFVCAHCQHTTVLHPKQKPTDDDVGGWCTCCFNPICNDCEKAGGCMPIEKKLDIMERRARLGH
jgi:hypothetical protein